MYTISGAEFSRKWNNFNSLTVIEGVYSLVRNPQGNTHAERTEIQRRA